jgi:hypothetical protein
MLDLLLDFLTVVAVIERPMIDLLTGGLLVGLGIGIGMFGILLVAYVDEDQEHDND